VNAEQLTLLALEPGAQRRTNRELGLTRDAAPGPARLLRELVRRGLDERHHVAAAALVLALDDDGANGQP
jgi:hypothetical protein